MFCPRAGPSLQAQEPRLQLCRRQNFQHKLRNQGCSSTRDWIGAVASRCSPHTTLSLASDHTLIDLKISQDTNEEVRIVDLANWAFRTSPKFTTRVKYQCHHGFWPDQRSGNPNHLTPPKLEYWALNAKKYMWCARICHYLLTQNGLNLLIAVGSPGDVSEETVT